MPPKPSAFPEDAQLRERFAAEVRSHPFSRTPLFTEFLPPWDQALLKAELLTLGQPFHVTSWGGYTLARGCMLGIHPMHPVEEARFPMAYFHAEPAETYHRLTREAVLNALELMEGDFSGDGFPGYKPREIGDVNATDTGWCGVVKLGVRPPVGEWAGIRFTEADQGIMEKFPGGRRLVIREGGSVAALRLDAVAGLAHKPTRSQFKTLIENGGAMLNYKPVIKGSAAIEMGDVISLRGFPTVRVVEIGHPNKKSRLWVRVESMD